MCCGDLTASAPVGSKFVIALGICVRRGQKTSIGSKHKPEEYPTEDDEHAYNHLPLMFESGALFVAVVLKCQSCEADDL